MNNAHFTSESKTDQSQIAHREIDAFDLRAVVAGQARLLASRAERQLPLTSGSLWRLVELGEQLDAIEEHAA